MSTVYPEQIFMSMYGLATTRITLEEMICQRMPACKLSYKNKPKATEVNKSNNLIV